MIHKFTEALHFLTFTKILNKRIYNHLTEKNFWSPNQNGLMKGRRTEDNLFILHTIFQKYVKQRKYTVFVDFRKFVDSIDRNCLLYKLLKCGITGNMYDVIKAAYNNPMFCIKAEHGLSEYFSSSTGMKQGCILSPILSNIFQNDRCNRLRCPLARMSGLQCFNMGHNGHGINLYGVSMTLMGN